MKDDLPIHRNKYDDAYMKTVTLSVLFGILCILMIGVAVLGSVRNVCEPQGGVDVTDQ